MGKIIGYAIFFKVLFFAFLIFLSMLVNKMFKIEKIQKEEWIFIGVFSLCDIISAIWNIHVKQYFLFYVLMALILGGIIYAYLKDKKSILSFLSVYSLFLVISCIWGFTFALDTMNVFKVYILSILISPISPSSTLDLWISLIIAIIVHVFSLLGMLVWPKIKEKVVK